MSEYVILIYDAEKPYRDYTAEQWGEVFNAHRRFAEQTVELGGRLVGGKAIEPTDTAVSFRDGTATEGPFVSTEPALCGYYLIEADNPEQARRIARLCPARYGGVELRPVKPTSVR